MSTASRPRLRPESTPHPAAIAPSRGTSIRAVEAGPDLRVADVLLVEFARFMADLYADVPAIADDMRQVATWGDANGQVHPDWRSPAGTLLLAQDRGHAVGVVGVRAVEGRTDCAEIKRLYVRPAFRGEGVARALLARAIDDARRLGYRALLLESGERFAAALPLYRQSGFREIPNYRTRTPEVDRHFLSMSLALA